MSARKKIVVMITRSSIGGAQNYVLSFASALSKDYEFVIYTSNQGYLTDELEKFNIAYRIIPSMDSFNILHASKAIYDGLKLDKPNLINTHSTLASIYGRLGARKLKIPLIYSIHGWFFSQNTGVLRKLIGPSIERFLTRYTTAWISETKFDQDLGIQHGIIPSANSCTIIANGIPDRPYLNTNIAEKDIISIAFIGRISKQKNPELAINTFQHLPSNYQLTIYCDTNQNTSVNQLIQTVSSERVKIIANANDTYKRIAQHDALLVTSRYEGMPLSVLEAMSAGLPVITTDICGMSELVKDGYNGYLVQNQKPRAIAKAIRKTFQNKDHAQTLAKHSRKRFLEKHTLDIMTTKIKDVFATYIR